MTFKSTRVERMDTERLRAIGELRIRSVTHEVALEATFNGMGKNPYGQELAGLTVETTINRKDFGLTWNAALESGGLLVGNKVEIVIEVQALLKS